MHVYKNELRSGNRLRIPSLEITMGRMEKHFFPLFLGTTVWMNDDGDDIILPTLSCASVRRVRLSSPDYSSFSRAWNYRVANFHLRFGPCAAAGSVWGGKYLFAAAANPLWRFIVLLSSQMQMFTARDLLREHFPRAPAKLSLPFVCRSLLNFFHYFCPFKSTQLNSSRSSKQRPSCSIWSNSMKIIVLLH